MPVIPKGYIITDKCCDKTRFYDTLADFPETGLVSRLYVDRSTGIIYVWDGTEYVTADSDIINTKVVYVDAGSGNDTTALRGYRNKPFQTLNAAIAAVQDGDLLHVFPGDYVSSISTNKIFNIFCENGVTWTFTKSITTSRLLTDPTHVNWKFDILQGSNPFGVINPIANTNLGVNLEINYLKYAQLFNNGSAKNFTNFTWDINHILDSQLIPSSLTNLQLNSCINLYISNVKKTSISYFTGIQLQEGGIYNVKVNNINWINAGDASSQLIAKSFASEQNTNNKLINISVDNIFSTSVTPLNTYPLFTNNVEAQTGTPGTASNTIVYYLEKNTGNKINYSLNGIFNTHTFCFNDSRQNTVSTVNIKGIQKKGFSFYTKSLSGFPASTQTMIVNLNVVSEDHAAVYLSLDNHILPIGITIIITGRIKVTRSGFPCIILGNNQNGRIVLKNLELINDGTVSPIMINSVSSENVQIQNVVTNSLVVDANITEVGQSIIRNANYK